MGLLGRIAQGFGGMPAIPQPTPLRETSHRATTTTPKVELFTQSQLSELAVPFGRELNFRMSAEARDAFAALTAANAKVTEDMRRLSAIDRPKAHVPEHLASAYITETLSTTLSLTDALSQRLFEVGKLLLSAELIAKQEDTAKHAGFVEYERALVEEWQALNENLERAMQPDVAPMLAELETKWAQLGRSAPEVKDLPKDMLGVVRVSPVSSTQSAIANVRRATRADAESIAAIQDSYQIQKLDPADHPSNGWLVQKSTPEAIREQMRHYKHFWVVENAESKIIGFQAVSAPRFISRPAGKHKFFGPLADVARRVLSDASFLYMSQIAVHPDYRGQGLASEVQRLALERYDDYPLIAHVAICTQADFDAWDGNPSTFQPRTNNVASHRFHQKLGYVPVAWTSDLRGTTQYNSGLTASNDATPILGVLYMRLPGMTASSDAYQDPVQAVLAAPCTLGECDSAAWKNPFPKSWPLKESDLDEMLGRVLAPGAARLLPAYDVLVRGPQEELQHMMR